MSSLHEASGSRASRASSPKARDESRELETAVQNDATSNVPELTTTHLSESEIPEDQDSTFDQNDLNSEISDEYEEKAGLYDFAEELRNSKPPVEPWFLEGSRLRRIYILWLNKRLAMCRKDILERKQPSDKDMEELGKVLHLQAEAARDLRVIRSLDFLTSGEQEHLHQETIRFFPKTAASIFPDVEPFETENYRRFSPAADRAVVYDGVREVLRRSLPKQISWPEHEKISRKEFYDKGGYAPERLSNAADRIARFIVAMGGALFILVPMYIMALRQSLAKNLITTTVAVVLFALVCSIPLKLANDQTFSATVGYAAVLMVFVGLTSAPSQLSG